MLGGDGDVQRRYLDFPWITLTLLRTGAPLLDPTQKINQPGFDGGFNFFGQNVVELGHFL